MTWSLAISLSRWFRLILSLVGVRCCFKPSRLARWFRLILSLVGVRCCFWTFHLTVVSSYHIVRPRQMLLLDVPFGGGFVLSFPRFALEALEFLSRLPWGKNTSSGEGSGWKGSNVFHENPPYRQKLAMEGQKTRFLGSIPRQYANSFCFHNSFPWAVVSFFADQKVIRKVPP